MLQYRKVKKYKERLRVIDIIIDVRGYVFNLLSFKGMTFAQRKKHDCK